MSNKKNKKTKKKKVIKQIQSQQEVVEIFEDIVSEEDKTPQQIKFESILANFNIFSLIVQSHRNNTIIFNNNENINYSGTH